MFRRVSITQVMGLGCLLACTVCAGVVLMVFEGVCHKHGVHSHAENDSYQLVNDECCTHRGAHEDCTPIRIAMIPPKRMASKTATQFLSVPPVELILNPSDKPDQLLITAAILRYCLPPYQASQRLRC